MNPFSFIVELKRSLPEAAWPWVFAALCRDHLVWDSLQGELGARLFSRGGIHPADLSPAALSLLALDCSISLDSLRSAPIEPVETSLRQRAARAAKALALHQGDLAVENLDLNLAQAGLLAIDLRERRGAIDAWEGLSGELVKAQPSSLACLIGMVPDPVELLLALLSVKQPAAVDLALHALLSQPLPIEEQIRQFEELLHLATAGQRFALLQRLSLQQPGLAASLAQWAQRLQLAMISEGWAAQLPHLADLRKDLDDAEAYHIAARPDQELTAITSALESARRLQAQLSASQARAAEANDDSQAALNSWKQAVDLDPSQPDYLAGLVQALMAAGRKAEAQAQLSSLSESSSAPLSLYTGACLANLAGDVEKARQLATQAASWLLEEPQLLNHQALLWNGSPQLEILDLYASLPSLLIELGLPRPAAQILHLALFTRPGSPEWLSLLALAEGRSEEHVEAALAAHLAVALAPDSLEHRRRLAESLEALEDWNAALEERTDLLAHQGEEIVPSTRSKDLRLLANCALRAGHPDQAAQACREAIKIDPSDGLTFTLLGESYADMGDFPAALDHLTQATQLAPDQAAPWLALSRTYQADGQSSRALEALQTASRASPDSPEIQLALGEIFLTSKATTQALTVLRRAADLANGSPSAPSGSDLPSTSRAISTRIALRLGQTLHQLGHLPEARRVLEQAFQSAPKDIEAANGYAQILLALGEQRAALSPLEVVLQSRPKSPAPYLDYARSALALAIPSGLAPATGAKSMAPEPMVDTAQIDRILSFLRQALEIAPDHTEAKAYYAEALAAKGDLLPAMDAYRRALETDLRQDPSWQTRLSLGLGQVALKIGQIETAIAALQDANQSAPLNPQIQRFLTEAYDAAGLSENALQAGRAAVLLAPDDIELLTWFAGRALELGSRPGLPASQAQAEAIRALSHATLLAPDRSDLLIRLGQVQMQAGDSLAARTTFKRLVEDRKNGDGQFRSVADLHQAARNLLYLGDAAGAVSCLEFALKSKRRRSDWTAASEAGDVPILLDLLRDLATCRYHAGNPKAALEALDQAINISPNEAALYLDKADLHLDMYVSQGEPPQETTPASFSREEGSEFASDVSPDAASGAAQVACTGTASSAVVEGAEPIQQALDCLEIALKLNPEDPSLHLRAALIQRAAGDLPSALDHAKRAFTTQLKQGSDTSEEHLPGSSGQAARALAADLARAQFMNRAARDLVADNWPTTGSCELLDRLDYYCLRAELALDAGDNLAASEDIAYVLEFAPEHPRALAAQARSISRRGDPEVALQLLHDAVEALSTSSTTLKARPSDDREGSNTREVNLVQPAKASIQGIGLLSARIRSLNNQVSVAESAVELHQWQTGLDLFRKSSTAAPLEPYFHLHLARALALRAEFQRLCQALDVVSHSPGESALSDEARNAFETAVQAAEQGCSSWPVSPNEPGPRQLIQRWGARGWAIFNPSIETAEELGRVASEADDAAARVACLSQAGDLASAGLAARAYPQHPRVLIQLSLALAREKPRQALAAAHAAAEAILRPEAVQIPESKVHLDPSSRPEAPNRLPVVRREDAPLVYALLARLVYQSGNRAGDSAVALQAIQTALSLWPDEPRWQALAARIYLGHSGVEEHPDLSLVVQHLEQAIKLEPRYAPHYLALGRVYQQAGAPQRAVQAFEQAARLAPELPEPWLELAEAFRAGGDLSEAAARAERAVTLAPQQSTPLLLRGEIALESNNPRGAQSRAQAALRLNPDDPAALLLLARSLRALDQPEEALAMMDKALPSARDPLPFLIERARLLVSCQRQEEAIQALQELADRHPNEPAVLSILAECLAEAGQRESAIHTAQRALRAGQENPSRQASVEHAGMHSLLGRLLHRAGQLDQAVHHLSEAIQHTPHLIEPYLELGQTHLERRQFAQALNAYQQAIAVAPQDPRGYYHAGLVYKESKDYISAEAMLRKAANLSSDDLAVHRLLAAVVALNLVHSLREPVREASANV